MTPPRTAFIEATRKVLETCRHRVTGGCPSIFCACAAVALGYDNHPESQPCIEPLHAAVLAQVEAAADMGCRERAVNRYSAPCFDESGKVHIGYLPHASCRAALRKECGL